MSLTVNNREISVDNEGYLTNPADWNEQVALQIADLEKLELTEERWKVIHFVRDYYEKYEKVPEARTLLKSMREDIGDKATRKYLYQLFPYGYGQQACKIAGTRKPLKLMLDV